MTDTPMTDIARLHKAVSELHATTALIIRIPTSEAAKLAVSGMTDKARKVTNLASDVLPQGVWGRCAPMPTPPYDDTEEQKAFDDITYAYDGPLNVATLIGRAMEHVTKTGRTEETANALEMALQAMGLDTYGPHVPPPFEC